MSKLCAYDIDGTIRAGSLLGDAIQHGIEAGFVNGENFADPLRPAYNEVDHFVADITGQSRRVFTELTDRLSDEAKGQTMKWALERLDDQHKRGDHRVLISHSPDFIVKAFARGLGVNHAYGSYFHTQQYIFSGRTRLREKTAAMQLYSVRHRLQGIGFAAGDTDNDIPMLEAAKHGVVVNPTARLGELATTKGWEIIKTGDAIAI